MQCNLRASLLGTTCAPAMQIVQLKLRMHKRQILVSANALSHSVENMFSDETFRFLFLNIILKEIIFHAFM